MVEGWTTEDEERSRRWERKLNVFMIVFGLLAAWLVIANPPEEPSLMWYERICCCQDEVIK